MNTPPTVFSQLMQWIHPQRFQRYVERYRGMYKVQDFSCWDQFLCMAFAQLTYRESLRDIEACLRSRGSQLYHLGFRGRVARMNLARANAHRDWRIYADLAQHLIRKARPLYIDEDFGVELNQTVYALDSTTIDLCLSLFRWARFRRTKAAIKLHTLLDLRGPIPTFIEITEGKLHDVNILDELIVEPGAFYITDRGYLDFARLFVLHQALAFFVIRAKDNTDFVRYRSLLTDGQEGVRSDHVGRLGGTKSQKDYPELLRRVHFFDAEQQRHLFFLTNHFELTALTIAQLYRCRWQVELFFKWIKQHLRILRFYGTSPNAVKTQIWIAICVYVLAAIIRKELKLPQSLHSILQVLSVSLFEKVPLHELLTESSSNYELIENHNQLLLFDL